VGDACHHSPFSFPGFEAIVLGNYTGEDAYNETAVPFKLSAFRVAKLGETGNSRFIGRIDGLVMPGRIG
jgi:hypothetical protein